MMISSKFSRWLNKLLNISYGDICVFDAKFCVAIGFGLTPFAVNSHNCLTQTKNITPFRFAVFLHCINCFTVMRKEIQQILSVNSHPGRGAHIGMFLLGLYITTMSLIALFHLNRKLPQFLNLVNFLIRFEELGLNLGRLNTNFLKFSMMQVSVVSAFCSVAIAFLVKFQRRQDTSVWYALYLWWDLTWAISLNLFVGFCGLSLGYAAAYVCVTKIYR